MSELICRECGKEMEYDWAPCPHCGWKAPESWEEPEEKAGSSAPKALLTKPQKWIQRTAWALLTASLVWLIFWFFRF